MSVGFQVFGDSGTFQINQDFSSLSLVAKGSVSVPYLSQGNIDAGVFYIPTTSQTPLICFQTVNPNVPVAVRKYGTTAGKYFLLGNSGQTPQTVNWFLFDQTVLGTPSGPNIGLQVFKADGSIAYDSRIPTMRIVSVNKVPDTGQGDLSVSLPASNYAACLSNSRIRFVPNLGNLTLELIDLVSTSSTNVSVTLSVIKSIPSYNPPSVPTLGGTLFVVDVTGL